MLVSLPLWGAALAVILLIAAVAVIAIVVARLRGMKRSNQRKFKFLVDSTHDLRQPIHAQVLFLAALQRTPMSPQQHAALESVRLAALASSDMLGTLLDFARMQAQTVKPDVHTIELQSLLHSIENALAPLADAKGLAYRSHDTRLIVRCAPSLVETILRNLVSNAIRYTAHGGVLVVCRMRAGCGVVEVWDTGIGMPQSIGFDTDKGLGMGLTVARQLTRVLGLSLSYASRPGRGTVFRLTLPLAMHPLAS